MASPSRHVLLLRGVNVGGKNKLPMKELVALLEDEGCAEVRTYIQSGNAVFRAGAREAVRVARAVEKGIASRLGLSVPVVLRSAAELERAAAGNPFLKAGAKPETLSLGFLAGKPTRAQAAALDPERSPGDSFELRGRELYLHMPNGVARSKLTSAYFDRTLGTTITARNWRTVLRLLEMTRGSS